jgi:cellulose synthase/poly-beta-1,6-N-acetylglucosamine synthase-like glycosyltransferase
LPAHYLTLVGTRGPMKKRTSQTTIQERVVKTGMTIIIPAFNEEASIADTIASIRLQSTPVDEVIVIDDCSTDNTAAVARRAGARVIRPPKNTGSKAGAQNFALEIVDTELVMALDADTTLAPEAIEPLLPEFKDKDVAAVCGFVLPRYVSTVWERGRYIEYLVAFTWYKPLQDYYGKPMISSGCFSMYRTKTLKSVGGWSTRTLAEDMDLTWTFYQRGYKVRFVPTAVCYPIEPHNYHFMSKQLRRWSHGLMQNVRLHWKELTGIPYLRSFIAVGFWDAIIASLVYLLLLPVLAIVFHNPYLLLGYIIDLPIVLVPVLTTAVPRKEVWRALASIPAFFVLRTVNAAFIIEAFFTEFVLGKSLRVYEKGH